MNEGAVASHQRFADEPPFPMTIWLRGDEAYFSDFVLSADETMEVLGIKRSRLTQISGRDLRVGRKKVERYIRPCYREKDVNAYLSWVRSTASHQKSANAIHQAATSIAQVFEHNVDEFNRMVAEIRASLDAAVHSGFREVARDFLPAQRQQGQSLAGLTRLVVHLSEVLPDRLHRLAGELGSVRSEQLHTSAVMKNGLIEVMTQVAEVRVLAADLAAAVADLAAANAARDATPWRGAAAKACPSLLWGRCHAAMPPPNRFRPQAPTRRPWVP